MILFCCSYHHHQTAERTPLGDCILHLEPDEYVEDEVFKTLKIVLGDGAHKGEVDVIVRTMTAVQAALIRRETVYEFERWQPFVGWGSSYPGHLYPTDPGCWCTVDGKTFGKKLKDVSCGLGDFIVKEDWNVIRTTDDADGWEYGIDFPTLFWYPTSRGRLRCTI